MVNGERAGQRCGRLGTTATCSWHTKRGNVPCGHVYTIGARAGTTCDRPTHYGRCKNHTAHALASNRGRPHRRKAAA